MIERMTDPYRNRRRPEWPPSLVEFLLARIAEDEAALDGHGAPWQVDLAIESAAYRERLRRECVTKRRLVKDCQDAWDQYRPNGRPSEWGHHVWGGLWHTLHLLASLYADHPDYLEEWRR